METLHNAFDTDRLHFKELQDITGIKLTCESCDCKYYVPVRKCKCNYSSSQNNSSADFLDTAVFDNPYLCTHFWSSSSIANTFREDICRRWFRCANFSDECTAKNTELWAMCFECDKYIMKLFS